MSASLPSALAGARATGRLHLPYAGLSSIPPAVFELGGVLTCLDLGHNSIRRLPPDLGRLTSLEELYLNGNPLHELPPEISACVALRHLDVRHTRLVDLPPQLSRLPSLVSVALDGTRVEPSLVRAASAGGCVALLGALAARDERATLVATLHKRLARDVFGGDSDTAVGGARIDTLVAATDARFPDNADLRALTRNAERLFTHEDLVCGSVAAIATRFFTLRDDNERKALGAELELALRAHYYDVADPRVVSRVRADIIAALPALRDARFLLAHARSLLPPAITDVRPHELVGAMDALRTRLRVDRDSALLTLTHALREAYPDRDASDADALASSVGALMPRADDLRALASDSRELLPSEFADARAQRIVRSFRATQADKGVGEAPRSGGRSPSVSPRRR